MFMRKSHRSHRLTFGIFVQLFYDHYTHTHTQTTDLRWLMCMTQTNASSVFIHPPFYEKTMTNTHTHIEHKYSQHSGESYTRHYRKTHTYMTAQTCVPAYRLMHISKHTSTRLANVMLSMISQPHLHLSG